MTKETKHSRFQRIANERKNHVLECLQALGNCSDPASYAYDAEALPPIFRDIVEKLAEVWHRLITHSHYPFVPFQLGPKTEVEIGGRCCRREDMVSMEEALVLLRENGACFAAFEPIRERYAEKFGNDLCWSYPFPFDDHLGCIILSVREGAICLPYNRMDSDTYEQIDLDAAKLLTQEKVRELMDILLSQSSELYGVLADVCRGLPASSEGGAAQK